MHAFHRPARLLTVVLFAATIAACDTVREMAGSTPSLPEPPATSFTAVSMRVATESGSETLGGAEVTPDFFREARVLPILGRLFVPGETRASDSAVAILSEPLWSRRFGADPAVIGRQIRINDRPVTIVAIMPKGFRFPKDAEFWIPR